MSTEDIKAFNQRLLSDPHIRAVFDRFALSDVDGVLAYAAELGYVFTEQDLIWVATELGVLDDELTEDELDAVAGGTLRAADMFAGRHTPEVGVAIFARMIRR